MSERRQAMARGPRDGAPIPEALMDDADPAWVSVAASEVWLRGHVDRALVPAWTSPDPVYPGVLRYRALQAWALQNGYQHPRLAKHADMDRLAALGVPVTRVGALAMARYRAERKAR